MRKITLKTKFIIGFLTASFLPLSIMGGYAYFLGITTLENEARDKLVAVREIKGEAIKAYFQTIKDQVTTLSHDIMIEDATQEFIQAYNDYNKELSDSELTIKQRKEQLEAYYNLNFKEKYEKDNQKKIDMTSVSSKFNDTALALQYDYIVKNAHPTGEKDKLEHILNKTKYDQVHSKFHPKIREYLQKFGYYDIFLVDIKTGNIVYSVFKEIDFATSLTNGPFSQSNLAKVFSKAAQLDSKESFAIVDFENYTPSFEAPASFIASPVWAGTEKIGILVFQMPIDRINQVMNARAGMGNTGETYLVGSDGFMRSDSFLAPDKFSVINSFKSQELGQVKSEAIAEALNNVESSKITTNYLGQKTISAYKPITILGLNWALIAEKNITEAFKPLYEMQKMFAIFAVFIFIGILFVAYTLASRFAGQITAIANKLFAGATEVARSSSVISQSSTRLSEASTESASSLQETVSSIDEISSMVQRNADAANSSTLVSEKSSIAAQRGKKTVEMMITSINDISHSTDDIASAMQRNHEDISKIVKVIAEIGEKTKVINDIVFQTKLLSFNASVEAARAGEHGKGFAVVAEEVGNLASMSGKAALEITQMLDSSLKQVTEIVEQTKKKVDHLILTSKDKVSVGTKTAHECGEALDEILHNVTSVNEMVREIAQASSEQSTGVQEVTKAMQQLDQTTHQNTTVAQESSVMAKKLKSQADDLNYAVNELMQVVTGSEKEGVIGQVVEAQEESNLVSLGRKRPASSSRVRGLKVSGLDTEVPREDDSRFEDL
jgi:methyl-accepting chemotaxis protein